MVFRPSAFLPKKLTHRLMLSTTTLVVIVGAISGVIQVKTQEQQLLDTIILGADQLSNGITSATWHAMLADNRNAAYEIMHTIALRQGINKIRIFNRDGRVRFSTAERDSGQVDRQSQFCAGCHSAETPLETIAPHSRSSIHWNAAGHRELTMVTPIYNEPSCSNAACHAHPGSIRILGVLDVTYGLENVDQIIRQVQGRMVLSTTASILVIGLFIFLFVRGTVHRPIAKLIEGTRALSAMQLDHAVDIGSGGELGELAMSFNTMRERLITTLGEFNELTQSLETKVEQRTVQLRSMNEKLFQSDRLASLGQLAASVAHEINNPIAGVLNLAMVLQRIITPEGIPPGRIEEVRKYLGQISGEITRVGKIVSDLLAFSRRPSPQRLPSDLNVIIQRTISILDHKLKLLGVDFALSLDRNIPAVKCDASQIQQVMVNVVMNGAEATQTKHGGKLTVRTRPAGDGSRVIIEITDNGDGIPLELLPKIFDPFFTTKGEGKGVGLGLAVVYGIVESHGGDIEVESVLESGTLVRITLPVAGEAALTTPAAITHPG